MQNRQPVRFFSRHRVKFIEIDPYGHLNTIYYPAYVIEHRFIGMRERLGYDLEALDKLPILFYTNKLEIEFVRPLLGDEEFEIESYVSEFHDSKAVILAEAKKTNGKVAARFVFGLTCVDRKTQRSCPWPEDILNRFYEDKVG